MASQDVNVVSNSSKAAWDRLEQRQEVILSQLNQLTSRLNAVSQRLGENESSTQNQDLSIETSLNKLTLTDQPSTTAVTSGHKHHRSRISSKDFAKLNQSQYSMLDRLLNIANGLNTVSKSQNVPQSIDINNSLKPIANMIDERLTKVTKKAQFLLELSQQQPAPIHPEPTPDSVRSQGTTGTPVLHPKRKLSSAGLEPMQILPFHNEPKETESEEFIRRIDELEYSVNHLKTMLSRFDNNKNGLVLSKDVYNCLSNMNLELTLQQAMHSRHIALILKYLTNDNNNKVNYIDLGNLCIDIKKTDRSELKHEWHHLRRRLIGNERKEGCLRIKYKFDNWPKSLIIRLFHSINTKENIVLPNDVGLAIQRAMKEHVVFQTIGYAEKSKHGVSEKTNYTMIDKNSGIPLHVERDGWLEIDVWLKTKDFLNNGPGRQYPKYA